MAESMCGPSNALQNFQKHSGVDRTLQQDRLVSRQSPAQVRSVIICQTLAANIPQGFRSSPGPNAGLLDPEFEAFQAGNLPLNPSFQHNGFSHAHPPPQSFHQAGPSAWASDFQRMNISSPLPQFQQQSFVPQAQQRHDTGGWHQDFARQQSQTGEQSMEQTTSHTPLPFQYAGGMNIGSRFIGGLATPLSEASSQQQKQPVEVFDDEAFARAFDEAAQTEQMDVNQNTNQEQRSETGQDVMLDETAERFMSEEADQGVLFDQERIGADAIHDPYSAEGREEQEDPDALSRTAGKLLNSVQHNQSSKFQNSQFLNLMRQFRDKQAVVEGDKVVGAGMEHTETNTRMEGLSSEQEAMKVA